jgi:sulfonate transport system substrate-binding protein
MSRKTKSLALFAPLALLAALSSAQADPLKLRIGWAQAGHLAPMLDVLPAKHPEVMPHFGKSYVTEAIRFAGSTPQIQAIAINELEIAAFASSSLALAITNADLDMRIVSDLLQDGRKGNFDEPYLVRKDGPIKTIEDLKGKRVATNAIGSASDTAMRIGLRKHGIADKDIVTVETSFTNMLPMIEDGKVDLIGGLPQTLKDIEATGHYRILFTAGEARGPAQTVLWAMRADFIKAHRPALVDFFEDHIRAVRWFLDPGNRDEALAITQQVTKQKREELEFFFTKDDFYRSPDALPDLDAAQNEIDESVKLGILPKGVALVPTYVDLSMVHDALLRIDGK